MEVVSIGPDRSLKYAACSRETPEYLTILSFGDWFCIPYEVCCPTDMLYSNKGLAFGGEIPSCFGIITGASVPYLKHAAMQAVGNLDENAIDRLAKREYDMVLMGDRDEKACMLIQRILGCSEVEALIYLSRNVNDRDCDLREYDEIVFSEEFASVASKEELKDVVQHEERVEEERRTVKTSKQNLLKRIAKAKGVVLKDPKDDPKPAKKANKKQEEG